LLDLFSVQQAAAQEDLTKPPAVLALLLQATFQLLASEVCHLSGKLAKTWSLQPDCERCPHRLGLKVKVLWPSSELTSDVP
jgi:hypothetical protein